MISRGWGDDGRAPARGARRKLTEEQRKGIICAARDGESKASLARRFGVSHGLITTTIRDGNGSIEWRERET